MAFKKTGQSWGDASISVSIRSLCVSQDGRDISTGIMHLSSSSPRGVPQAVGGGIGDFVGILQHICAPVVGEMKGL